MKESVEFGTNKSGAQIKPNLTHKMEEGYSEFIPRVEDASFDMMDLHEYYIQDGRQLGTVPLPGSAKNVVQTGIQLAKGKSPAVLVDKLGERLAFERVGVRLYEALITKCKVLHPEMDMDLLERFMGEEAQHFILVKECMEKLGADPTAMTPCANSTGVASAGLIQVLNDPRTTLAQCVQAILIAEMTDITGWELLIELADDAGLRENAEYFRIAKDEEDIHLSVIQNWLESMTLKNEFVSIAEV